MKTITDAFKATWRNPACKFAIRQIKYKRRYWLSGAFHDEANWHTLEMRDFNQIGSITQQLDTVKLNEFQVSNITLQLLNHDNRWLPYNTLGIFGADGVATSGYTAYKTQFQILGGYELADGSDELLTLLTGFMVDYNASSTVNYLEVLVIGYEVKLKKADAQLVSDTFTDEATVPSAGDDSNCDFSTTSNGVDHITQVKLDGSVKTEAVDYKLNNNASPDVGAIVSFTDAPVLAQVVLTSGRKWRINKTIETLIGYLCDQAGIASGDRDIQNVLFPNGVNGSKTITSQSEWKEGTLIDLDADISPGNILLNFLTKIYGYGPTDPWPDNPTWEVLSGSFNDDTTRLICTNPGSANIPSIIAYGSWRFFISVRTRYSGEYARTIFRFISSTNTPSSGDGYALCVEDSSPSHPYTCTLYKVSGDTLTPLGASWSGGYEMGIHITRSASGEFKIYQMSMNPWTGQIYSPAILKLTVTDNTYTMSAFIVDQVTNISPDTSTYFSFVTHIRASSSLILPDVEYIQSGVYISKEFDILSSPTAWGLLSIVKILNGGSVAGYVESHASPGGEGTYVLSNPQIIADLNQYFKIELIVTSDSGSGNSPSIQNVTANFTTSQIFIALANFAGMTCYDAIQKLAKLCNYEWGFDGVGKFFFRKKDISITPDIIIDQKDIIQVSNLKPGWDSIINKAQMRYGDSYYKEYSSDTLPETAPSSKDMYGECIKSDDVGSFLLANDANLATGAVQILHDDNYVAKLRATILSRLIPHIELSDIAQVSFYDDPLQKDYIATDQLQTQGDQTNKALLRDKLFKIVGIRHDLTGETTELSVVEVLTS